MERLAVRGDGVVARLTINDAPKLDAKTRKKVADWLRKQAALLEDGYSSLSPKYTARWLYHA